MTPSFFKALWLRETHPEVFAADVVLTDVHGYLVWRLAGVWATSLACADPTGLVDMSAGTWAESLLGELGLDERGVPALVEVGSQVGAVTANASEATGISAGTPLFAGAGDGQCAGLGAGITGLDTAYLNLGTAMVSGVCSPRYQTSLAYRTLFAAYPGHFQLETDLKGGTFTLNWLASTILGASSPSERLAALEREAVDLDPGVDGLYCVPYFCGVMNPYWDDSAGGTFVGLRGSHGPAHLYRAILEGLCFEQRLHSDAVQEATGVPIEGFITMGGGSRSDLFCQIVADVTGRSVVRSGTAEATALGAGILAAVGAGLHPDVPAAVAEMTSHGRAFAPGDSRARYDALYAGYKRIYPALAADQG
jgi:xylulokinase